MNHFRLPAALAAVLAACLAAPAGLGAERNYKRWLEREVNWIISKAEKETFRQLKTDAEKKRFVERFWADRDPTPATPKNEYQEEHYRRLAFATENFRESGPGWRSDRGRVFVIHGPPLSRSSEAEREIWTYHSNPNAEYYKGPITLVFQRAASAFQERLISDSRLAQQKADERPGAALQPIQTLNNTARYRLVAAGPGFRPELVLTAGDTDRYIADILRSPGEVLEERERQAEQRRQRLERLRQDVETQVSFEPLPFSLETFFFPLETDSVLVLLVSVEPAEVRSEAEAAGGGPARFDLYCEAREASSDFLLDVLDATLEYDPALEGPPRRLEYHDRFTLPSKAVRVSCLARGVASGRTRRQEATIEPETAQGLALSRPILTQRIQQVERTPGFDPLVLEDTRFTPQTRDFDPRRPLYLFFQVFDGSDSSELFFDYQIHSRDEVFYRSPERPLPAAAAGSPLPCALALDLSTLQAGRYFLLVKVQDFEGGRYSLVELPFQLSSEGG